ncbi:Hypothetical protein PEIBARAKI_4552 [Petrimonas sp. IBARAKI]|jgi:hypothetical protein|nr:Hypothetical protein PEIBARAKI_4552 [Petrimonas sp. IBARAKI]
MKSHTAQENDQVNEVCLNATGSYAVYTLNAAQRSDGSASFEMPGGWKPASSHFGMFLTSYDLQFNSNNLYIVFQ